MALYDSLLLPALEKQRNSSGSCYSTLKGLIHRIYGYESKDYMKQPADLLHARHLLIVGPKKGYDDENDEDGGDLESQGEDLQCDGGVTSLNRSATELKQAGIDFKKIPLSDGIRGIKFSTNIFREVGSYVRFMSDLIVTPGDAKLLSNKKIIQANRDQREKLPKLLKELANNNGYSTQNVRVIRLEIEDYSQPPWEKIRHFLSLVLVLTLVQTVYTVLSYYKN